MEHLTIANGIPMLILCIIVVAIVLVQPILMSRMAIRQAKALGYTNDDVTKVVKSSAIFALLPSMPILASYLVLVPVLGRFFPWMRLSVVGSVTYETTVASSAAAAFGFDDIYSANFPPSAFLSILLILTIGILAGNIFNLFFLKTYGRGIAAITAKNSKLMPIITSAIFVALYSVLSAPTVTNGENPVGIITFFAAGLAAVGVDVVAKRKPALKEHAFSLSLLVGMIVACLVNPLFN